MQNVAGVTIGGTLGHSLCTGLAVIGGRLIAQRISVRTGKSIAADDENNIQLSPKEEVNSGGYILRRAVIYPPLFTDPEGDSCFSIYQIRWIKIMLL